FRTTCRLPTIASSYTYTPLFLSDPAVKAIADRLADLPPVEAGRGAPFRQPRELLGDLLQRQPELLRDQDEAEAADVRAEKPPLIDRKSTRLNSSHVKISYAVFCM